MKYKEHDVHTNSLEFLLLFNNNDAFIVKEYEMISNKTFPKILWEILNDKMRRIKYLAGEYLFKVRYVLESTIVTRQSHDTKTNLTTTLTCTRQKNTIQHDNEVSLNQNNNENHYTREQ